MKIHTVFLSPHTADRVLRVLVPLFAYCLLLATPARAAAPEITPCLACHSAERLCRNVASGKDFWTSTVQRMIDKGAHVAPEQVPGLVALLANPDHAEVRKALDCPPPGSPEAGANTVPTALRMAHPLLMSATLLLALWVGWQGVNRARFTLLGHKAAFNWKGHVRLGLAVMILWLLGMSAGTVMTALVHGSPGAYDDHRETAMTMLPLILFGLASGLYMDRKKAKRKILPILHGAANLVLIVLALSQLVTGIAIVGRILFP
jgi:hypothetical protein